MAQPCTPAGDVVRFQESVPLPDGAAFESCYDRATGRFTCPAGGLVNVTVRAALAVAGAEEVIEADFEQVGGRCVARDVAA